MCVFSILFVLLEYVKETFQARHGSGGSGGFNRHIIETPFYSIKQFKLQMQINEGFKKKSFLKRGHHPPCQLRGTVFCSGFATQRLF